jgi:hypothetical protein
MNADGAGVPMSALPKINYYPPVVVTTLAAILLFLVILGLGTMGVLNTLTQIDRAANNIPGASFFGAAICGLLSIIALLAGVYFLLAAIKGVRDLGEKPQFTRGTVASKRESRNRKADGWLMIEPAYAGPDLAAATAITDEQEAASVDRSEIVQPRFASDLREKTARPGPGQTRPTGGKQGGYLSPERISASNAPATPSEEEGTDSPRVIFRIDFAARTNLSPDEEVLVAHSRYLEHVFYVARLRNGEWEVFRNKKLI